ncbi:hypothetical protein DI392_08135 [Vibrio albus]|uniref:Uncharacterized protein n=1 Tax=Vibrio albus TaxID=2200953 RepID=A0A2U3BBH6_9VIBR|nr:DUF3693 domain-containing protein [Vibrio albus]PWI34146.1 hypothetical protein DI392_08135 [Vibrio albus]
MYENYLLNEYLKKKNYVQDKQIAHDLGISTQKISGVRTGTRHLTENEVLFLAKESGVDTTLAMVVMAASRSKTFEGQQAWKKLLEQLEKSGIKGFSMSYTALVTGSLLYSTPISKYVLCILC